MLFLNTPRIKSRQSKKHIMDTNFPPKDAIQTWSMETIKEPPDAKDQSVTVMSKLSLSDLFFLQSVNVMRLLGCVGLRRLRWTWRWRWIWIRIRMGVERRGGSCEVEGEWSTSLASVFRFVQLLRGSGPTLLTLGWKIQFLPRTWALLETYDFKSN